MLAFFAATLNMLLPSTKISPRNNILINLKPLRNEVIGTSSLLSSVFNKGFCRIRLYFQVTIEYTFDGGACLPRRVHTVVLSTQHNPEITMETLRRELMEKVVKFVIPADIMDENTIFHLNPCGSFITGGPMGDAGLTGRKIIVDTYGGWGAHGGR